MQFSPKAVELIKEFEGFSPAPYRCPAGKNTIGYGHSFLGDSYQAITEEEAVRLLHRDLMILDQYIHQSVKVTLKQGQYDALSSLVYNWGCRNFRRSQGLKFLNKGRYRLAASEFFSRERGVVNVGGKFFEGLHRRRQAELRLWNHV
jgi:lysozyme